MKLNCITLAIAAMLAGSLPGHSGATGVMVRSVEFFGMPAPVTPEEKADVYSRAEMKILYENGVDRTLTLRYHRIMATTDMIGGSQVGGLFDSKDAPVMDSDGQMASDAPDGTSLMHIDGLETPGAQGNSLALVTQFEYRQLAPNDGMDYRVDFWSKLPATMGLTLLDQDKVSGLLTPKHYSPISFSSVNGGWIHCGSTLSAWNTHVGSEEYEPDAKTREGLAKAVDSDDKTDIHRFSRYYFGDPAIANPYHYGLLPEVTVDRNGNANVVKHFAAGRYAREMQVMATDNRTAIGGDDGKNTGLFMFVADKEGDLAAGTLYAASVEQIRPDNGGTFDIKWIRLGHATDAEIKALVDDGIRFSDIFEVISLSGDKKNPCGRSFRKVVTYTGTECLRLNSGMERAAAFLETRRYAAYLGATTEFSKMEYIAFNKQDRKFYIAVSRVEKDGMADGAGDIRVAPNDGGMILEMETAAGIRDSGSELIDSQYVGTKLSSVPALVGGWLGKNAAGEDIRDSEGNRCQQDRLCGPDNLVYADSIRTLFIGEDTSRRNNNYVWAYNIDSGKLSRILSVPMAAEATGLMVAENYNGHAYIMSNFQHPGAADDFENYKGDDRQDVLAAINSKWGNRKKAAIGYIGTDAGALPALK
jgi:secreted PhoX family phosphatase